MTTEITVTEKQLAVFDIESAVFAEIKSYENLNIVNSETEKDVRAARVAVRDVRYKIQNRQKELNSDLNSKKKEYKEAAETLIERLKPTEDNLDTKIKAIEAERKIKKAAKDKAEADRLEVINDKVNDLKELCLSPLAYNLSCEEIDPIILALEVYVIDDSFQEMKPQAEMIKTGGIAAANQALKARQDWEAQQAENKRIQDEKDAENKRVRLENEAKAKELKEAQAKIEAEQERVREEATRKAKEAADRQAKADAEAKAKREAGEAKLAKEREEFKRQKLEAEKAAHDILYIENARIAEENRKIQAEKDRMAAEVEKARMDERIKWCESVGDVWMLADIEDAEAFQSAFNAGLERSKEIDESIRIEQLAAKEKRAALVEADKKDLIDTANQINDFILDIGMPLTNTEEAAILSRTFRKEIESAINKFEKSLTELA